MRPPTVPEIEAMDRADLSEAWEHFLRRPVPKGMSQPFLRRLIAFEVQARRQGGLPKNFLTELGRAARPGGPPAVAGPRPGGRLLREWNGITHVVEVTEGGYLWDKATYPSLSAVARAITGARWSGPRFFGLKEHIQ